MFVYHRHLTALAAVGALAALSTGCSIFEMDDPSGIKPEDVLTLDLVNEVDPLSADGSDVIELVATLEGEAAPNQEVTFRTDRGTFAGPGVTGTARQEAKVVAIGRTAHVRLVAGTSAAPITVTASVGANPSVQTTLVVFPERVSPVGIELTANRVSAPADGTTTVALSALLRPASGLAVTEGTRVLFRATAHPAGFSLPLLNREDESDASGVATVSIVSQESGAVRIVAYPEGKPAVADTVVVTFGTAP